MTAYYNEWDSYAAQWLRNLIAAGHLPAGDVDERSITDVEPDELSGYTQWHFFAGIGGWSYAARLAGVRDDERIVTGSPPCQPFSSAGRHRGYKDERHLAPHWLRLVAAIRPTWVFAEQVAAAIKKDNWLDDLLDALENEGYTTGAIVLPGCSVCAPHIRQRLWVAARLADTERGAAKRHGHELGEASRGVQGEEHERQRLRLDAGYGVNAGRVGNTEQPGLEGQRRYGDGSGEPGRVNAEPGGPVAKTGRVGGMADSANHGCREECADSAGLGSGDSAEGLAAGHGTSGGDIGMADADSGAQGVERSGSGRLDQRGAWEPRAGHWSRREDGGRGDTEYSGRRAGKLTESSDAESGWREAPERCIQRQETWGGREADGAGDATETGWDAPDWLYCRDGKWRPVESGTFPLAHGLSTRVGRLRAYGNAIIPQVAAEVIKEAMNPSKETA